MKLKPILLLSIIIALQSPLSAMANSELVGKPCNENKFTGYARTEDGYCMANYQVCSGIEFLEEIQKRPATADKCGETPQRECQSDFELTISYDEKALKNSDLMPLFRFLSTRLYDMSFKFFQSTPNKQKWMMIAGKPSVESPYRWDNPKGNTPSRSKLKADILKEFPDLAPRITECNGTPELPSITGSN